MKRARLLAVLTVLAAITVTATAADMPKDKEYTNSIGMKLMRIEPGKFRMGQVKTPLSSDVLPIFRGRGLFDTLKDGDYCVHHLVNE